MKMGISERWERLPFAAKAILLTLVVFVVVTASARAVTQLGQPDVSSTAPRISAVAPVRTLPGQLVLQPAAVRPRSVIRVARVVSRAAGTSVFVAPRARAITRLARPAIRTQATRNVTHVVGTVRARLATVIAMTRRRPASPTETP